LAERADGRVRIGRVRRLSATALAPLVIAAAVAAVLFLPVISCGRGASAAAKPRMIVLGFDGMDYDLTQQMMAEGKLPNFSRLAKMGSFTALGTAIPPQSPVAWSNFITGMDAGGHGIFDFVHRDPKTMVPYLSTSRTEASGSHLKLGKYQIPLKSDKIELLRYGTPFWEVLEKHGVPTTIVRMPANFPPSGTATKELSGMGTPDIIGSYGTFSYYTSDPAAFAGKDVSGGRLYTVAVSGGAVTGSLAGPKNPFLVEPKNLQADFTVYLDPVQPAAKLVVGDEERLLRVGEWTDWVPMTLEMIPTQSIPIMARFYLKSVRPAFGLYVTPLNLDPKSPAMPISTPNKWAGELADATGRFYTQGMPEDTKAFKDGIFSEEEFLRQSRMAGDEVVSQYDAVLDDFRDGFLFYYFGNGDQISHMMWRPMDPGHPAYKPEEARFKDAVPQIYELFDGVVGRTLEKMPPDTTLVVMSDHGFTSWRRAFHLNTWLKENGFLAVIDPYLKDDPGLFSNVDWSRTKAYGLGINGLYINLQGREKWGIVTESERKGIMDEISRKLVATIDPVTGAPAVTKAFQREEAYHDRGHIEIGPDIVVGYAKGTRGSNESALGKVGPDVFTNNTEEWSGDHCMDPDAVPGILVTSRPLKKAAPRLQDLAAALLAEYGIEGFPKRGAAQPE